MKINEHGFWENETAEGHGVDENLASALVSFFKKNEVTSVIDLGCGNGYYVKRLNDAYIYCKGYDGNPHTREISVHPSVFVYDLTKVLPLQLRLSPSDWCLSLEVGEHIPQEYEKQFLNNIVASCVLGVVLSWAVPDQGGDGHVNCRTNEYIINEMSKRNFEFETIDTLYLRQNASKYPNTGYWFKNSLMVFWRRL